MTLTKSNKIFLLLILALIILRLPSLFEGFWYMDEGFYATQAEAILRGKELYLEAWDHKPPLMVWIYSLGGVFGWNFGYPLIKIFSIIAGITTLVILRKLLIKEKIPQKTQVILMVLAVLLLGTPLFEGNLANSEVFFVPLTTGILYLSLYRKKAIVVGLLLSLTFLIKPQAFVEGVAIISLVAIFDSSHKLDYKYYLKLILAFLTIISSYFIYLIISGSFTEFIDAAFITNFLYVENEDGATKWNIIKLVFAFSLFIWMVRKIKSGKTPGIGKTEFVVSLLLAVNIILITLSGRPYPHYLIQIVPSILFAFGLFIKNTSLSKRQIMIVVAVFLSIVLFLFSRGLDVRLIDKSRLKGHMRYYIDFPQYLLGNTSTHSWFWKNHDNFLPVKDLITHFEENYAGLDYYYYGEQPWIFTQLNGNFVNKYLVWYHLDYSDEKMAEGISARNKAMVVIIDESSRRKRPQFFADLEDKFTFMEQVHNYRIYVNNDY